MTIKQHSILNDFPEMSERIYEVKRKDGHFARLSERYDELEHSIHLMESGVEAFADEDLEELKKKRLQMKDELFSIMRRAA